MATLADRLTAGFQRVRDQFNAIKPRLMPLGGAAGAVLSKTTAADNAVAWVSQPYGFAIPISGKPTAGEMIGPFVADRAFTIPNGFAGSISNAGAAATATSVFTLTRNGSAIGTITYAGGSAAGVLATSTNADVAVARGDRFFLVCPSTQDGTLADIGTTVVGTR